MTPRNPLSSLLLVLSLLGIPVALRASGDLPALRPGARDFTVRWIRASLEGRLGPGERPRELPGDLMRPGPERVVLSLLRPGRRPLASLGEGENLGTAVHRALEGLHRDGVDQMVPAALRRVRIRVDRLGSLVSLGKFRDADLAYPRFRPGVDGLLVEGYQRQAVLLPYEVVLQGLSSLERVDPEAVRGKLLEGLGSAGAPGDAPLHRFTTRAFQEARPGEAVAVVRLMPRPPPFGPEVLDRSLKLVARRLARVQRRDGGFLYFYDPVRGQDLGGENYVRQAAVVATAIEMAPLFPDGALDRVIERGLGFLLRTLEVREVGGGKKLRVPPPDRKDGPSLGAVALYTRAFAIAPTRFRDDPRFTQAMRLLGRALAFMQRPDGSWYRNLGSAQRGEPPTQRLRFFPGEALLALSDLAEADPAGPWQRLAARSAARERKEYTRSGWIDHWVVQGLARFARLTDHEASARVAYEMAREMVGTQVLGPGPWLDVDRGGFSSDGERVTVVHTGCYGEALREARKAAWRFGLDPRPLEAALVRLGAYLVGQQFRPEGAAVLRGSRLGLGGFPASPSDFRIRIDVDGHAARALLGTWESLHDQRPVPQLAELAEQDLPRAG